MDVSRHPSKLQQSLRLLIIGGRRHAVSIFGLGRLPWRSRILVWSPVFLSRGILFVWAPILMGGASRCMPLSVWFLRSLGNQKQKTRRSKESQLVLLSCGLLGTLVLALRKLMRMRSRHMLVSTCGTLYQGLVCWWDRQECFMDVAEGVDHLR